jgi:hypothetical protein
MLSPDHYPNARRLSLNEAIAEIEHLIKTGKWTTAEKGLPLWKVWKRVGDAVYIDIFDALHALNKRGDLVETRSVYWYVKKG